MDVGFFSKIFFYSSLVSVMILFFYYNTIDHSKANISQKDHSKANISLEEHSKANISLKYILEWTSPKTEPFVFLGIGQEGFIRRQCKYSNCYVTSDRAYLQDLTDFDVILFHGPEIHREYSLRKFPSNRSPRQKYVFASMESSHYYPVCSQKFDSFFNWTWTFRLDSDARWGYILIRNKSGAIIGPNKSMNWMKLEDMHPTDETFKESLKSKRKAAAWFVSNCNALSGRKKFVDDLRIELKSFGYDVDVYGKCGTLSCNKEKECQDMIKDLYYFYMAFENSFSEDYVTEKLLRALKNNAVPVVFGGANYSRFMPDGIYLNARQLGVKNLANKMVELIMDPEKYAEYFKWKNHYSFHYREEPDFNEYCEFCALLNDEQEMSQKTVVNNFKEWWNNPNYCA